MIITLQYQLLFILAVFLTILSWLLDATWLRNRCGVNTFNLLRNLSVWLLLAIIIWLCVLNFPATLTALVFGCGIIYLLDALWLRHARTAKNYPLPVIVEQARSFFWVLLLVWVIRSFIIQPYRVPTGSLQPTVKPGDLLVVNQFAYGLRFPVGNGTLIPIGTPKRGDIVLFYAPLNPGMILVKRLIGLPGDHIAYHDKVLTINGKSMPQTDIGATIDDEPAVAGMPEEHIPVMEREEDLDGLKHHIFVIPPEIVPGTDFETTVPAGHYFMMGDNRDNSDDSRSWGFVSDRFLIGKAFGIWMSWDSLTSHIRWNRIGQAIR